MPDPVAVLSEALSAAGVDPAPLNLREETETAWFPGANFSNHNIVVDFGNGNYERIDVALMLANPRVAVLEIQRMLKYYAAQS